MVEASSEENKNKPSMRVSEKYLTGRVLALQTQQEQLSANFVLTPDMVVKQPFEPEFTCSICYNVVKKPKQCKECDRLQCDGCLAKWWERSQVVSKSKCPLCSKNEGFRDKVNSIVMSWLNAKNFKCSLCASEFSYDRFEPHMREECELAKFKPDC